MTRKATIPFVVAIVVVVVLFCWGRNHRPEAVVPEAVIPKSATERQILELANAFVKTQGVDWKTPVSIEKRTTPGTFVVTYFTPDEDIELLGHRQILVTPSSELVEFVLLD